MLLSISVLPLSSLMSCSCCLSNEIFKLPFIPFPEELNTHSLLQVVLREGSWPKYSYFQKPMMERMRAHHVA